MRVVIAYILLAVLIAGFALVIARVRSKTLARRYPYGRKRG